MGDKPQKLEWSGYGFYIEVPEGALPPDVTASVAVKVILAGQFELPEDSQLISAIFCISSSEMFLKEVAVYIQHCAVITSASQCSEFKFIIASCSQDVLPYKFKEKDGLFNVHTQYAVIKAKQFSFIGIKGSKKTKLRYMSLKFHKPITCKKVDYVFVLFCDLKPYVKVDKCMVPFHHIHLCYSKLTFMFLIIYVQAVRQEYAEFKEDKLLMQAIDFESAEVELDLPFSSPTTVDNWKIQPLTYPKVLLILLNLYIQIIIAATF